MNKKKPKVYIPPYKIIILCGSIIAVCMLLLLLTNLISVKKPKNQEKVTVAERFNEEKENQKQTSKNQEAEKSKKSPSLDEIKGNKTKSQAPQNKKNEKTNSTNTKQKSEEGKNTQAVKKEASEKTAQKEEKNTSKSTNKAKEVESPGKKPVEENLTTVNKNTENLTSSKSPSPQKEEKATAPTVLNSFNLPAAINSAQLVFVFDDGGQNMAQLESFLELPFPITIAVLPKIAHSKEAAERIRKSGNEVILHQPMQAINKKVNPGPGAITPEMDENQIISTLFQNINEIGPIAGMNNHEGSAITADAEKMSTILKIASENGIYFLDSRTNVDTKVPYVASELGYSYYERNIFLDNTKNRNDILNEIKKGIALANKNGVVIMIGHIWSAEVLPGILKEIYPELVQKGYTFSTVSKSRAKK